MSRVSARRVRTDERGFMLVEIAVGASLILIGLVGLMSVLASSRDLVSLSEHRETALNRAQLEIERVRAYNYTYLALASAPGPSADPLDPDYHVKGGATPRYRPEHLATSNTYEDLVISATTCAGTPSPCPALEETYADGNVTGEVHRYVTWSDADGDGTNDMKRVTVAVTVDQQEDKRPVTMSTLFRADS